MQHKLLIQQIKEHLGPLENIPPHWESFLHAVDSAYKKNDADYALLEQGMNISNEENLVRGTEIEQLSHLPNENPNPILRISKEGQLLYFNRASLNLLRLIKANPAQPLPLQWQKLARDAFDYGINRTIELEFSGHFFSVTFSPIIEHNYVNIYGFDINEQKLVESYLLDHNNILGSLVAEKPFQKILDELSKKIEKYSEGLLSSILLLDKSKNFLHYGSAPSLPAEFVKKTRKVFLGPKAGSCGTAAFQKRMVIAEDISQDPLWEDHKDTALSFGLRACWSTPILDFEGNVLGTFAVYYNQPRKPSSAEIEMIKTSANFAALAIQNHNAKNDLKNYAEELKRSNNDLKDFAHIASHDLQEPLRKISIFSDRLKEVGSALSERHQDYLARMTNAAERMQTLIADLLQLSQVNAIGQPFKKVDLTQVSREVIEDLDARLMETQGKVTLGDLPSLNADPRQMQQLLQNLIENALKYHKPGTPPLVHLNSQLNQNGDWNISVQDNGIGLDEKFSERIFVPLERLHGRSAYEGTGIGLAICKKIVSRHGGSISVKSQPGEGSTFTISLPTDHSTKN